MSAIEIITSNEKRRYWTRAEKRRWVLALEAPDANASATRSPVLVVVATNQPSCNRCFQATALSGSALA